MSLKATKKQMEVFEFITEFVEKFGFPPTRQEIACAFGYRSQNAAECHVRALEKHGLITIMEGVFRGISIIGKHKTNISAACPHCGQLIAAVEGVAA